VNLVFKDIPSLEAGQRWLGRVQWLLISASLIVALALLWLVL
jgi:hypothetical protein